MANPLQWRHTEPVQACISRSATWPVRFGIPTARRPSRRSLPSHWYAAASNNYAIAMTESPAGSYLYAGTFPAIAGNMTAGWYWVDAFAQAGASPAIGDTMVATLLGWWTGRRSNPMPTTLIALGGTVQTAGRDLGVVLPATALNNAPALTDYQHAAMLQ